jgi:hypothetical protein
MNYKPKLSQNINQAHTSQARLIITYFLPVGPSNLQFSAEFNIVINGD